MNTELTREEEIQVAKLTGSIVGTALMGAARILKGTGWTVKTATGITAAGFYCVGGIIEGTGSFVSSKCTSGAEYCEGKAEEYKFPVKKVPQEKIVTNTVEAVESEEGFDFTYVCC